MAKRVTAVILLITMVMSCCGCWNLVEIDRTAIVAGLGVDLLEDDQMHFAVQLETATTGEEESVKPKNTVLVSNGQTMTEAARNITLRLPRIPLWPHASSLVIGENLARHDLALIADFFMRNRNVRMDSDMLVASNLPLEELFSVNDPLTGCSLRCMEQLLRFQESSLGIYVPVSIAEFFFKLATPGVDPVLPVLTVASIDGEQDLKLQGTAVFKDRRLVGYLNEKESRGYRWLNPGKNMGGLLGVEMPEGKGRVVFEVINFKTKQTPRLQDGLLVMDIEIQAEVNFFEQTGTAKLVGIEQKESLEIAAARQIKQEVQACITKSQELTSDVLGWGRTLYRHYPAEWEELQDHWQELYPETKANIRVNCRVDRTYMGTRSFEFK
ncbi:MAG TPA: Ger(x)C family spore germination protein [Gelria sp.]|nr:Ger(x)C family spore germination protein [Gelria sp.]